MAIVLPDGRPAIDIVDGGFETPEKPWAHLGDPEIRPRLEAAIRAVGRLESDDPDLPFLATAFAVGPDLAITAKPHGGRSAQLFVAFEEGDRIPVSEEIPLTEGHVDYALLRLPLPDGIEPLQLSTLPTTALVGRDVVAVGYPASDARNDPALMQRVFRGVFDVERLLPGRVTGLDAMGPLQHDCSTAGGCGGAPLVDVETGEVVGIHYGGQYLKQNMALPATKVAPAVVLALGTSTGPSVSRPTTAPDRGVEGERPATRHATNADADPVTGPAPLPSDRPAVAARGWRDALEVDWRKVLKPHEFRVDTAIRAVGRVLNGTSATDWNGTAFLVGDRLALTASFIAETFAEGSGRHVTIRDGCTPAIDFCDALGADPGTATAAVTAVRFIHPYFQVALLELGQTPAGVTRLDLAARLPADLSGRPVVLVAHSPSGALFMHPGRAQQVGELPDDSKLPVLAHDCANNPGSAGGPVVDLGTGYVIGLHSHGNAAGGFAQPPWELARDPVLWEYALGFRPDPRPPWLTSWNDADARPASESQPTAPPSERWTVNQKIDWTLPEPQELEELLVEHINPEFALYHAETIGLPLGQVSRGLPSALLWRELLKAADTAGVLRGFIQHLADQPEYAGIAPLLRNYL
jgi:endonuclease G